MEIICRGIVTRELQLREVGPPDAYLLGIAPLWLVPELPALACQPLSPPTFWVDNWLR